MSGIGRKTAFHFSRSHFLDRTFHLVYFNSLIRNIFFEPEGRLLDTRQWQVEKREGFLLEGGRPRQRSECGCSLQHKGDLVEISEHEGVSIGPVEEAIVPYPVEPRARARAFVCKLSGPESSRSRPTGGFEAFAEMLGLRLVRLSMAPLPGLAAITPRPFLNVEPYSGGSLWPDALTRHTGWNKLNERALSEAPTLERLEP